jgi:hypothetical protein
MSKPDELWKNIIEDLFEDVIEFFMPDLYPYIDFSKGFTFLDKELKKIFPKSKTKKRYPDHLVQVYLKNGSQQLILIHIEIQGYRDKNFSERMFTYFYRIYDKHKKPIVALCIFIDKHKEYKPACFEYNFFKTKLTYEYRIYKLIEQDEKMLSESNNPFAMAALVGLYQLKSGQNITKQYESKVKLLRLLLSKGFSTEKISSLLIFLDTLLTLTPELEDNFEEELFNMLGGREKMKLSPLDSPVARKIYLLGEEKGEARGEKKGLLKAIKLSLTTKFSPESLSLMTIIDKIDNNERLNVLLEDILKTKSLDEVKALLQ